MSQTHHPNRRTVFAALGALALAAAQASLVASQGQLTARQVIDRIKDKVGVPWQEPTVDTFKAGNPDQPIAGVAVTMMATYDVLQRAPAGSLVITHEPTFYGHQDETATLEKDDDAVYKAKQALIANKHLVVWRFHDYWHRRQPDGILTGVVHALGWESFQSQNDPEVFQMPETTLKSLAASIRQRLNAQTLRVVGDPALKVTKVGLSPGFGGFDGNRHLLQRDDVQALVIGEAHEWETVEYSADAVAAGKSKALIAIGHIPSEQPGMDECVRWLRTFVSEVPIEFVPAKDPFWQ